MKTIAELEAKIEALYDLAIQANRNCLTTAGYLRKYRPELAAISFKWVDAIGEELETLNEN